MKQVKLLKPYQNHDAGEIISVSNNVAFGLIDSGAAINPVNRDFLVKPEFGETRAIDGRKLQKHRRKSVNY